MSKKCPICTKTVYPMDAQINLDGSIFHLPCAKCQDCKCQITLNNFAKHEFDNKEVLLLCKTHLMKRFHEEGSYIGAEKYKVKAERDVHAAEKASHSSAVSSPVAAAIVEQVYLTDDEQKVPVGQVKKDLETRKNSMSSIGSSGGGVSPPRTALTDDERSSVPVREITRRMSTSRVSTNIC
jgi:hypothetical protein